MFSFEDYEAAAHFNFFLMILDDAQRRPAEARRPRASRCYIEYPAQCLSLLSRWA